MMMLRKTLIHMAVGHTLTSRQQQALAGHFCSGQQPPGSHLLYTLGQATTVDMMNTVYSLHWPAQEISALVTNPTQ
jgi:hypothetical protein